MPVFSGVGHALRWAVALSCLSVLPSQAQLPAGTSDASSAVATSDDGRGTPLRQQASLALEHGDFAGALKLLTQLSERNPNDAPLWFDLGSAQDALDQSSSAETSYRRAIAVDAQYFEPHLAVGLLLARTGKMQDARTELLAATAISNAAAPLRARAFRALARVDENLNPAEARDALLDALKLSPETPDDIALTASLAEKAQDLGEAERAFRRLLALRPEDPAAVASLTGLLLRENKTAEAQTVLQGGLKVHPDDPALSAALVQLYLRENDPEKALATAKQLHAADPTERTVTRLYARLLGQTGDYVEAEPLFAALRTANPLDPTLADDDADALIHLKRYGEAEQVLKVAVRSQSSFPTPEEFGAAASHLAFAASQNSDPQTVLQAVALRATVLPKSPAIVFLEAIARDKLHELKAAKQLYTEFLSVSDGKFPDEEWEARHRLIALEHTR